MGQIEMASLPASLREEASDRARQRRRDQEHPKDAPLVAYILPAEAAELYHRKFCEVAVRAGFMPPRGGGWAALDDRAKTAHCAAWREMLAALRQPEQPFDETELRSPQHGANGQGNGTGQRGG